ncbi:hypothetical protein BC628DRAFT_1369321 [Trametes gibbosa]|nr:hypothetical protein BC628DRAFT_1369321 [Trametes gibbosa]
MLGPPPLALLLLCAEAFFPANTRASLSAQVQLQSGAQTSSGLDIPPALYKSPLRTYRTRPTTAVNLRIHGNITAGPRKSLLRGSRRLCTLPPAYLLAVLATSYPPHAKSRSNNRSTRRAIQMNSDPLETCGQHTSQ